MFYYSFTSAYLYGKGYFKGRVVMKNSKRVVLLSIAMLLLFVSTIMIGSLVGTAIGMATYDLDGRDIDVVASERFSSFNVYASELNPSVVLNGQNLAFTDALPFVDEHSRTQVPVRALAEALGCEVTWNEASQEVTITKSYLESEGIKAQDNSTYVCMKELHLFIGKQDYDASFNTALKGTVFDGTVNTLYGTEWQGLKSMDTAPIIKGDRTYLPARYVAEYFGYTVGWDGSTNTVIINK
jgi:hypothetical protein